MNQNIAKKNVITIEHLSTDQQTQVDNQSDASKTIKVIQEMKKKPINPTPLESSFFSFL